jgi:hypothetical protein
MMVSAYSDDVDHIDVFGEWQMGKAGRGTSLRRSTRVHLRNSANRHVVEKIEWLTRPSSNHARQISKAVGMIEGA